MLECEGCARRRAALYAMTKRMAEWVKHPIGPAPLDLSQRPQVTTDPIVEARALALFIAENPGATENDWRCATEALRIGFRVKVENGEKSR